MTKRKLLYVLSAGYSVINLSLMLMFHIPMNIIGESSTAYDYFRYFLTEAFEMLMPTVGAALLFALYHERRASELLIPTLAFSLPRVFYLLPYYYLYATFNGNDWQESLGISLLITVLGVAISFGVTYGLSMLIRLVTVRSLASEICDTAEAPKAMDKESRRRLAESARKLLPERVGERGLFDLSAPATLGVFVSAAAVFLYSLLFEIYEIIAFLAEYGSFYAGEIVYTVGKLVFVFCMLFVMHISMYFAKNCAAARFADTDKH